MVLALVARLEASVAVRELHPPAPGNPTGVRREKIKLCGSGSLRVDAVGEALKIC
jgi:hypothetical protein